MERRRRFGQIVHFSALDEDIDGVEDSGGSEGEQSPGVEQDPADQRVKPFIIEKYDKDCEEHNREVGTKRPKLGIKRLLEEHRLVQLTIDIPIDQTTIFKETFDWDLSKKNMSPKQFAEEFCQQLGLDKATCQKLKLQIFSQIMHHIRINNRRKKTEDKDSVEDNFEKPGPATISFNDAPEEDQQQNERKNKYMQRRIEMKRTNTIQSFPQHKHFKEKKVCKNCRIQNINPGFQCKVCKIPFYIVDVLNLEDARVKVACKYYSKVATKIPLLVYEAKQKLLKKEDFYSFYQIYNCIKKVFLGSAEVTKDVENQIKYIVELYRQNFQQGNVDFSTDNIIFEKEAENQVKRKRGRPRKVPLPIIQDPEGLLNPDQTPSNNASENQEGEPEGEGEGEKDGNVSDQ